jgi:hypothetical protein
MNDSCEKGYQKIRENEKYHKLKVCVKCKKIFYHWGAEEDFCPGCRKIDEEELEKVKSYISENPAASLEEAAENTKVDPDSILRFLREEKLEMPEDSPIYIKCKMCHRDIRIGKLCRACEETLKKLYYTL